MDDGETEKEALIREVKEESQKVIWLKENDMEEWKLLYSNTIDGDQYSFYFIPVQCDNIFFEGNIWDLTFKADAKREEREMSCIIKVPIEHLRGKEINYFLAECKTQGGKFVNIDGNGYDGQLDRWFNDKGTQDAFKKVLEYYKN